MDLQENAQFQSHILQLESEGRVTRTFRRLDINRQQAILQSILDEAAEYGPAAVNIKRVAERAGVAVGSLYQYFHGRDGLLDFAIEFSVRYITQAFDDYRPVLAAMPLREALAAYLSGGIEWSQTKAGFLRLFARAAYQGDPDLAQRLVVPVANSMREMIFEILLQAVKRGEVRADIDLDAAARLVHAWMIAAGDSLLLPYLNDYFQVCAPEAPFNRTAETLVEIILNGIAAQKP